MNCESSCLGTCAAAPATRTFSEPVKKTMLRRLGKDAEAELVK